MPKPETMAQKHKKAGLSREQALETEVARLRLIFNKIKKRRPPLSEKTIFRIAKDNVESAYDTWTKFVFWSPYFSRFY